MNNISENFIVSSKPIFLTKEPISISFEGMKLKLSKPIYRNINRYYLPLEEFVRSVNGRVTIMKQKLQLLFEKKPSIYIDTKDDGYKFTLVNNTIYASLFDICRILNIKSRWNYDDKSISLYWDKDSHQVQNIIPAGRVALIRFEDITAGEQYLEVENLEKFRVVADYLFSLAIPFHIAWIPRFIDPPDGIDNDISKDYSMKNAHFLFTIEYLLNRNGVIGLHGYTHQYGNEVSGEGTEFNEERNNDKESIRKRVEAAINISKKLELPIKFFESPHYASTAFQQSEYENYFNIIYEGCVGIWGEKAVISPRNHKTLYVPTPLGYVEGDNGTEEMLKRINNMKEDTLASLFYHPYGEFDYITLRTDPKGYPLGYYSDISPLQRICTALYDKGCRFSNVTQLYLDYMDSQSQNTSKIL